ncbi:uncharacterized protein METZ01_LOCUS512182 [marine metagenome]|uniref:Uncharacterized protein n=1 Tax=marine metagenome TaxID=408172 RepID=A0A383ETE6_9ZZZZ
MNNSIMFQYITALGPVVYFSGNNGLFIDLLMMDKRSEQDERDFEELLQEHLIKYFSEHGHQYIYYRIGDENSNCQLTVIKGLSDGHIAFNYETEFSDFSKNQITDDSEYNDLVIIFPNNVDVFYDGSQELKTIKLKISSDVLKSKKMKKINTGKNQPNVELPILKKLIKE